MAYIRKVKAGWRAEVERKGVRDSITLPTKSAASQWATKREAEILAGTVSAWPRRGSSVYSKPPDPRRSIWQAVLKSSSTRRGTPAATSASARASRLAADIGL